MEEAKQTFYWYDLETFGLDRRRDRPAQFAGCRTDADLNFLEGGSGETLYMRPSEDYLPSPESVLLTGITPQEWLPLLAKFPGSLFASVDERLRHLGFVSGDRRVLGTPR